VCLTDAEKIKSAISGKGHKKILFIGAGFISMEIASLLAETKGGQYTITVVELMDRPLPLMLDKEMANSVRTYLEEKGITIVTGDKVDKLMGQDGNVIGAKLSSGETIDADVIFRMKMNTITGCFKPLKR
jgi:NADH oxidase (H2O2-forming)